MEFDSDILTNKDYSLSAQADEAACGDASARTETEGTKGGAKAFGVSFDASQKRFFALVKSGILAVFALVLFALSFAPVHNVKGREHDTRYSNVSIIAMMFDTAYEWDADDAEKWNDKMDNLVKERTQARRQGNFDKYYRLSDELQILITRLYLRTGAYEGVEQVYIVRGLIGFFLIVFALGMSAIYVTSFVLQLTGRKGLSERWLSKRTGKYVGGCTGVLFAGYLMYLMLFLLAVCAKGYDFESYPSGTMVAALTIAALGTALYAAEAFLVTERADKRRLFAGITVFMAGTVAVGTLFSPALTFGDKDTGGRTDGSFFLSANVTDEAWEHYDSSLHSLSYPDKQEYYKQLLDAIRVYDSDEVDSVLISFLVVYDDAHMTNGLQAGYYMWLLAAAALGAAATFALAYGVTGAGAARTMKGIFVALAIVGMLAYLVACAVTVGLVNSNIAYLELSSLDIDSKAGMGAGSITAVVVFAAGLVASALIASFRRKKDVVEDDCAGEEEVAEDDLTPEDKEYFGFLCTAGESTALSV